METLTDLSIWQAKAMHEALTDALAKGEDFVLDLSGVERVDVAGLQIVWLAHREAAGRMELVPGEALEKATDRLAIPHFWKEER